MRDDGRLAIFNKIDEYFFGLVIGDDGADGDDNGQVFSRTACAIGPPPARPS